MCGDPEQDWFPQRHICYPTMAQAAADRAYEALHKDSPWHNGAFTSWAAERDADHPFHYKDGVTIIVAPSDLNPDDQFLTGA